MMKIFMAVMAGVFALSCVTDTTEDLAIEFGKGEGDHITKLPLSLEQSRTQLDEKAGDLYPVVWSENDAIAVNGVASMPLVAEQAGSSSAVFSLLGELERPFNVVYPAPAADVESATEGLYPVTFLATQEYVSNSFCNGAAPMYGYAAAVGDKIEMHHLAGVLRLAVKGNGEAITKLVVKAQSGKIAGNFDVNCKTGELTPHRGASNTVTMPIESGLTLGAEATHFYVAIPAGLHGVLFVTLHTATDKMTVTVNSDLKPVVAGSVREFKEFTYGPNDINTDGDIFEIDGVDALMQFATLSQDFHPYTVAEVTADIDMTGIDWTPIENFNGYTFNGNDFEIKGLNAPLFGTTTSTIKNVNLVDVNIASNGRLVLGAVACVSDGITLNCKVSGNITVNNADATIASGADAYTTVNYGGVVGRAGGDVISCVNLANITVEQLAKSDNSVAVHPIVGGVVGYSVAGCVTNCVNGNEAKTAGAINYHDTHATQLYTPHVGGVAGSGASDNIVAFHNNTNYGAIDFLANTAGTGELSRNSTTIGGVIASSFHNVENNDNYGTITVSGGKIKGFILGGVVGTTTPDVRLYNCHNHQGANITVDSDVAFWALNVAGVVGTFSGSAYVDTCTNDAPIHVKASTDTNATANGSQLYRVGGVITYANNTVKNCENKANGDITVEGNITLLRANNQPGYGVVGVLCYQTTTGNATNLINRGDINVYTNVTPTATWTTTTTHMTYGKIDIAGVCGYCTRGKYDLQNYGNITIGRAESAISITGNGLHIGGLMSYGGGAWSVSSLSKNINNGKITITNATLNGKFTPSITENAGEDNEKTTTNPWIVSIGGVSGYPTGNISNSTNSGTIDITSNAKFSCETRIGGAIGDVGGDTYKNISNTGDVTFSGNSGNYTLAMGGMAGANKVGGTYTSCSNNGVITLTKGAKANKAHYIAGVISYTVSGTKLVSCTNSTKSGVQYGIVVHQTSSTTGGSSAKRIGGIIGQAASPQLTNVSNSAGIYHDGYQLGTAGLSLGGIVGTCSGTPTASGTISNSGDIYYAGRCPKSNFGIAGIFATPSNGTYTSATITNTGNITIVKKFDDFLPTDNGSHRCVVGGICGYAPKALSNAKSYCTISAPDWRADSGTAANNNFIGAIQGINTPTNHITKCHVGGTFIISNDETPGELNASNYATYLIGGNVITSATAKTQECGFITSIDDTTPEYAE
ncbi:MAG: hypothetical protein J6J57_00405 [Alistipes sp.]|nr:hypothetical protein [Alistipes sp.]